MTAREITESLTSRSRNVLWIDRSASQAELYDAEVGAAKRVPYKAAILARTDTRLGAKAVAGGEIVFGV